MDDRANMFIHRENMRWNTIPNRLPVTLVTGFLGSGKTTLLKHILLNKANLKLAAAVNDFAAINIDSELILKTKRANQVVELSNGCMCCSIKDNFQDAVYALLQESDKGNIDYLLIETSGVTDPVGTIATLQASFGRLYRIRLDCVVTVVDTDDLVHRIREGGNALATVAQSQLACADVVVLNKIDLVDSQQLDQVKQYLTDLLPGVRTVCTKYARVFIDQILAVSQIDTNSVSGVLTHDAKTIQYQAIQESNLRKLQPTSDSRSSNEPSKHLEREGYVTVVYHVTKPLSFVRWQHWLAYCMPQSMVRMKGTIWFIEDEAEPDAVFSFHLSGRRRFECERISSTGARQVQLVMIGTSLDRNEIIASLAACHEPFEATSPLESASRISHPESVDSISYLESLAIPKGRWQVHGNSTPAMLLFRLFVGEEYGVDEQEMYRIGINVDEANSDLVRKANYAQSALCLTTQRVDGKVFCRFAIGSGLPFSQAWDVICQHVQLLIDEHFQALLACKCGW